MAQFFRAEAGSDCDALGQDRRLGRGTSGSLDDDDDEPRNKARGVSVSKRRREVLTDVAMDSHAMDDHGSNNGDSTHDYGIGFIRMALGAKICV